METEAGATGARKSGRNLRSDAAGRRALRRVGPGGAKRSHRVARSACSTAHGSRRLPSPRKMTGLDGRQGCFPACAALGDLCPRRGTARGRRAALRAPARSAEACSAEPCRAEVQKPREVSEHARRRHAVVVFGEHCRSESRGKLYGAPSFTNGSTAVVPFPSSANMMRSAAWFAGCCGRQKTPYARAGRVAKVEAVATSRLGTNEARDEAVLHEASCERPPRVPIARRAMPARIG